MEVRQGLEVGDRVVLNTMAIFDESRESPQDVSPDSDSEEAVKPPPKSRQDVAAVIVKMGLGSVAPCIQRRVQVHSLRSTQPLVNDAERGALSKRTVLRKTLPLKSQLQVRNRY